MPPSEPLRVYRSGRILRVGAPLLAVLIAAATTSAIQAVMPISGAWSPVVATAGGVAVAALLLLWQNVTRRHLEVFDGWFRYVTPDRTLIAHWDDVVEVFSPTSRRRRMFGRHEYVVVLGGGTTLRLGSQIGADAHLGDEIETRTRNVIATRCAAHIASGRTVAFGPISVGKRGIEIKGLRTRAIRFDGIRDHRLRGRHYLIRSLDSRRTIAIRVSRIPSPGALHDVIQQRMDAATAVRDRGRAAA